MMASVRLSKPASPSWSRARIVRLIHRRAPDASFVSDGREPAKAGGTETQDQFKRRNKMKHFFMIVMAVTSLGLVSADAGSNQKKAAAENGSHCGKCPLSHCPAGHK